MKLALKRKYSGLDYIIGDLLIDGTFFCNTIEDIIRKLPEICPDTPDVTAPAKRKSMQKQLSRQEPTK